MSDLYEDIIIGNQSAFKEPNTIIFSCLPGTEVMRLDLTGMTYKGQRIEDAGEAHRVFLEAMKVMMNGGPKEGA